MSNTSSKGHQQGTVNVSGQGKVGQAIGYVAGDAHYHEGDEKYTVSGTNPYLGLQSFEYKHRDIYAGRDKVIAQAVALLTTPDEQRVVLFITGASGSGKSSLAQAGIVPALEQHYQARSTTPRRGVFRPSKYPLSQLTDALKQLTITDPLDMQAIQEKPARFYRFLAHTTPTHCVNLLVIDQFEELFTQSEIAQRNALFVLLEACPPFDEWCTHIIITLRSDYLPELFAHNALYDVCKQGIDLREMIANELEAAIQKPLQQRYPDGNKRFEPALLTQLALDAAADATYLPLLQVTLEDIWRRGKLVREAYGALTDAISHRAETIYHYVDYDVRTVERSAENQQQIMTLLLALVEVSLDEKAHRDVRQRRTKQQLTQGDKTITALIDELSSARLLSTTTETRDGKPVEVVDIIHEMLIAKWDGLRKAIEAERDALQQRVRFEQALNEWKDADKKRDYLLTGVRLSEAEELAQRNDVALRDKEARAFLQASVQQRDEEQQRELAQERKLAEQEKELREKAEQLVQTTKRGNRVLVRGIIVAFLFAIMAGGAAWFAFAEQQRADTNAAQAQANARTAVAETQRADDNAKQSQANEQTAVAERDRADQQAQISLSRQLAAQAGEMREENLDLSLLLAVQADIVSSTVESKGALLDGLQYSPHLSTTLRLHKEDTIRSISFSPDGKTLAVGGTDNITLWNIARIPIISTTLSQNILPVYGLAFNPSEQTLISLSSNFQDATITNWNITTYNPITENIYLQNTQINSQTIRSPVFSLDNKMIAFIDYNNLCIWDMETENHQEYKLGTYPGHVVDIALSPDGKKIALATCGDGVLHGDLAFCNQGEILLWNDVSKEIEEPLFLSGHIDYISSLAFSQDSHWLASGGFDNTIILWDLTATPISITLLEDSSSVVSELVFSTNGKILASGNRDGTVFLWDVESGQQIGTPLYGHTEEVYNLIFSPDDHMVASVSQDSKILLWDIAMVLESKNPLDGYVDTNNYNIGIINANGQILTTEQYNASNSILWDITNTRPVSTSIRSGNNFEFSPDGKKMAMSTAEGITLWDTVNRQSYSDLLYEHDRIDGLAVSGDGKTLISVSSNEDNREIILWNIENTFSTSATLTHYIELESLWELTLSHNGKLLVSNNDDRITLWDISLTPPTSRTLQIIKGNFRSLAFSHDDEMLAVATCIEYDSGGYCKQGEIRLWNIKAGIEQGILSGHTTPVFDLEFSPNGKILASWNSEGIMLWDTVARQSLGYILKDKNNASWLEADLVFSSEGDTLISGWCSENQLFWPVCIKSEFITLDISVESWKSHSCHMVNRNLSYDEWQQYMGNDRPYEKTCPTPPIGEGVLEHGDVLARQGKRDEAIAWYKHLLEIEPTLDIDPQARAEEITKIVDE